MYGSIGCEHATFVVQFSQVIYARDPASAVGGGSSFPRFVHLVGSGRCRPWAQIGAGSRKTLRGWSWLTAILSGTNKSRTSSIFRRAGQWAGPAGDRAGRCIVDEKGRWSPDDCLAATVSRSPPAAAPPPAVGDVLMTAWFIDVDMQSTCPQVCFLTLPRRHNTGVCVRLLAATCAAVYSRLWPVNGSSGGTSGGGGGGGVSGSRRASCLS